MRDSQLFPPKRSCCCCLAEATPNQKRPIPGEPIIVSISLTIYRRATGKGRHEAAPRIQICEACLIRALAGGLFGKGREGSALWGALRNSIAYRFGNMIEGEQMQAENTGFWRELRESLPFPSATADRGQA